MNYGFCVREKITKRAEVAAPVQKEETLKVDDGYKLYREIQDSILDEPQWRIKLRTTLASFITILTRQHPGLQTVLNISFTGNYLSARSGTCRPRRKHNRAASLPSMKSIYKRLSDMQDYMKWKNVKDNPVLDDLGMIVGTRVFNV